MVKDIVFVEHCSEKVKFREQIKIYAYIKIMYDDVKWECVTGVVFLCVVLDRGRPAIEEFGLVRCIVPLSNHDEERMELPPINNTPFLSPW